MGLNNSQVCDETIQEYETILKIKHEGLEEEKEYEDKEIWTNLLEAERRIIVRIICFYQLMGIYQDPAILKYKDGDLCKKLYQRYEREFRKLLNDLSNGAKDINYDELPLIASANRYLFQHFCKEHPIFWERKYCYIPCGTIGDENITTKVIKGIMKRVIDAGVINVEEYANLINLYLQLPKSVKNYDNVIKLLYMIIQTSEDSFEEGAESPQGIDLQEEIYLDHHNFLTKAYTWLSKLIYLPFLYGYGYPCQLRSANYLKILSHLENQKKRGTTTMAKIVISASGLSQAIIDPVVCDSPHLQRLINDYIINSTNLNDNINSEDYFIATGKLKNLEQTIHDYK